jgi:hypothetical protein
VRVRSSATGGYGLGLGIGTYSGTRVITHDGGAMGFGTTMFTLPSERLGIIILTNIRNGGDREQLPFNAAVTRRIVELQFADAVPLADKKLAYYARLRQRHARVASPDHAWVAPLVGTYHDPALGDVVLRATADGADLDAGEWHTAVDAEIEPGGTMRLIILDPPFAGGAFVVGPGPSLLVPGYPGYKFIKNSGS